LLTKRIIKYKRILSIRCIFGFKRLIENLFEKE
jgi:hypothetical protein